MTLLMILLTDKLMTGFPLVEGTWGEPYPNTQQVGLSPPCPPTVLPRNRRFCNFHAIFGYFAQIVSPPPQVDPIRETLDDTTPYSKFECASDLWQQLELAAQLKSDLQDTVDWVGSGLLISILEISSCFVSPV